MSISTVAVFSDADKNAPYVSLADEAVHIGKSDSNSSYLNMQKLIAVCKITHADAIHPGYGFLSENPKFAKLCDQSGVIFIGPSERNIRLMGSKQESKNFLSENTSVDAVPLIPGYQGKDQGLETLRKNAIKIGFPLIIKASAGGGGKGMRVINKISELEEAVDSVKREGRRSFGSEKILLERYFTNVKHIEIQILGDVHGDVIDCGFERECSIQRRHQKIVEESPSPSDLLGKDNLRERIAKSAVAIGKLIGYVSAGTVEFILDPDTGKYYFLELNTRLQVEHPVTEMVTGFDLVRMQIEIANGLSLKYLLRKFKNYIGGHSIEVRLCAEDPENNFFPSPGKIIYWKPYEMEGVRYDNGVATGYTIPIFYDPMICKIISWGRDREEALQRMVLALRRLIIIGPKTNLQFLINLMQNKTFRRGNYTTKFIEDDYLPNRSLGRPKKKKDFNHFSIVALLVSWVINQKSKKVMRHIPSGWRYSKYKNEQKLFQILNEKSLEDNLVTISYELLDKQKNDGGFQVKLEGKSYKVELISCLEKSKNRFLVQCQINLFRRKYFVFREPKRNILNIHSEQFGIVRFKKTNPLELYGNVDDSLEDLKKKGVVSIVMEMPGKILKVLVKDGEDVKKGDLLIVIESMKMENKRFSDFDGKVKLFVKEGDVLEADTMLLQITIKK